MTRCAARPPIRVLVVDDSRLMRAMLTSALEADGDISVVGAAGDTLEARNMIKRFDPDVVTLDIEMPGMNGLEFLGKIMSLRPTPVVMVSSLTDRGADVTVAALQIGAVDAVAKPDSPKAFARFARDLRRGVRSASRSTPRSRPPARLDAPIGRPARGGRDALLAIGASTGGVAALSALLARLPANFPPIVIAQHMPSGYTERFAARLRDMLGRDVAEGRDGEELSRGAVRIAPGGLHMEVAGCASGLITRLNSGPAVRDHRPSVDVLFRSVAAAVGRKAVGALLTGMGRDGAQGLLEMREQGARCIVQGPESCVVYGMPRAALELGAAHEQHELDQMADPIIRAVVHPAPSPASSQETFDARR